MHPFTASLPFPQKLPVLIKYIQEPTKDVPYMHSTIFQILTGTQARKYKSKIQMEMVRRCLKIMQRKAENGTHMNHGEEIQEKKGDGDVTANEVANVTEHSRDKRRIQQENYIDDMLWKTRGFKNDVLGWLVDSVIALQNNGDDSSSGSLEDSPQLSNDTVIQIAHDILNVITTTNAVIESEPRVGDKRKRIDKEADDAKDDLLGNITPDSLSSWFQPMWTHCVAAAAKFHLVEDTILRTRLVTYFENQAKQSRSQKKVFSDVLALCDYPDGVGASVIARILTHQTHLAEWDSCLLTIHTQQQDDDTNKTVNRTYIHSFFEEVKCIEHMLAVYSRFLEERTPHKIALSNRIIKYQFYKIVDQAICELPEADKSMRHRVSLLGIALKHKLYVRIDDALTEELDSRFRNTAAILHQYAAQNPAIAYEGLAMIARINLGWLDSILEHLWVALLEVSAEPLLLTLLEVFSQQNDLRSFMQCLLAAHPAIIPSISFADDFKKRCLAIPATQYPEVLIAVQRNVVLTCIFVESIQLSNLSEVISSEHLRQVLEILRASTDPWSLLAYVKLGTLMNVETAIDTSKITQTRIIDELAVRSLHVEKNLFTDLLDLKYVTGSWDGGVRELFAKHAEGEHENIMHIAKWKMAAENTPYLRSHLPAAKVDAFIASMRTHSNGNAIGCSIDRINYNALNSYPLGPPDLEEPAAIATPGIETIPDPVWASEEEAFAVLQKLPHNLKAATNCQSVRRVLRSWLFALKSPTIRLSLLRINIIIASLRVFERCSLVFDESESSMIYSDIMAIIRALFKGKSSAMEGQLASALSILSSLFALFAPKEISWSCLRQNSGRLFTTTLSLASFRGSSISASSLFGRIVDELDSSTFTKSLSKQGIILLLQFVRLYQLLPASVMAELKYVPYVLLNASGDFDVQHVKAVVSGEEVMRGNLKAILTKWDCEAKYKGRV